MENAVWRYHARWPGIHHAVERIYICMDLRGDKCPVHSCKDGRGFKGIQKRVLHAHGGVERECEAVCIEELIERAGGVATDNPRLMEIELHEEGVLRSDVPEIVGQTVSVIAHGSCKEVCKVHNLSAHRSVHHEGALRLDHLKGESR